MGMEGIFVNWNDGVIDEVWLLYRSEEKKVAGRKEMITCVRLGLAVCTRLTSSR